MDPTAPLVTNVDADHVCVQIASADVSKTIDMVGKELLPELPRQATT